MKNVDQATLSSLAAKLEALELTDKEQALFVRLIDRATAFTPEVSGFNRFVYDGDQSGADLSPAAFRIGRGIGVIPGTINLGIQKDDRWPPPP